MMTPSFLAVCAPADLANLDTIYLIGEAVPRHLADTWCVGGRTVYNAYGPCECTIAALFKRLEPGQPVTLGRTIPRVDVYILDDERRPVPVGVVGEIYLTGVQVTEGYIGEHMAKATRSVFLDDPFVPGLRMYKTGDAAAWTESLEVQFLGRLDDSLVKVRGYRVELDEVALAIRRSHSRIQAAVAVVSEDKDRILAFVSPATVDTRGVLVSLTAALPPYARPSVLMALDRFPTTPNQKLDRKALQQLASQSPGHGRTAGLVDGDTKEGTGQTAAMEKLLSRVWSEVLRLPEEVAPSADNDFLALGGNSLRQITAAQKVSSALGIRVPLRLFVKNPGLGELAEELNLFHARHNEQHAEEGRTPGSGGSFLSFLSATEPQKKNDYLERASHLELELFEMHERSRTPSTFNVAHVVELTGLVDLDVLERAIRQIVRKSDILRCCFRRDAKDGQLRRTLNSVQDKEFIVHRWGSNVDYTAKEQELVSAPFDLGRDQLTRIALVETNEGAQCKLVLVQHHIITDQTSARRFFQILGELYTHLLSSGMSEDDRNDKKPGPSSYASWACWKSGQLQLAASESTAQGRFWKDKLATAEPLPTPFPPRLCSDDWSAKGDEGRGHMSFTAYPPLGVSARAAKAGAAAPRPMEHFLAAVAAALGRSAGNEDVVICIPFIDRLEPGTEEILGLFLDRLPVRVRLPAALAATASSSEEEPDLRAPLRETIAAARLEIQAALSHALPGRCIAEVLAGGRDNGTTASGGLFDAMLVYNRREDSIAGDLRVRGVTSVRSVSKRAPGAKFPFLVEFNELEDGAVICEIEYMSERVSPGFVEQIVADLKKLLLLLEDA